MAMITNKRSVMTLYSGVDIHSHRIRIVLKEKGVPYESVQIEMRGKPEDLLTLNPYGNVPTLVDRDLVLYEPNIVAEYLDERFPHPPLMPVYPVARAKARLIMYRFDREWTPLIRQIETGKPNETRQAAKALSSHIVQLVPAFNSSSYFMGDEFTLVDCLIAPVLWRLPVWQSTSFPADKMKVIEKYANRLFARESFQESLTESEKEFRQSAIMETAQGE